MIKQKEVRRGKIKQKFQHFTAIPFYLKDENLTLEQANDWQSYYVDSKEIGFKNTKDYPWALFNVKYMKDWETKGKWKLRVLGKQITNNSKAKMLKTVSRAIVAHRDTNYENFTSLLDAVIRDIQKLRDGTCELEIEMAEVAFRPERREVEDKSEVEVEVKKGKEKLPETLDKGEEV